MARAVLDLNLRVATDLGKEPEWVVLSLETAEHVGSHFWLSQRFGALRAVQDAKVIEGRVRSDVGLILRTARQAPRTRRVRVPGRTISRCPPSLATTSSAPGAHTPR